MQLKSKAGLTLLVLGVAIFGGWKWWLKTRNFVPVDVVIASTGDQTITSDFRLNFDGLYFIEIAAHKSIPLDTLHCLMGVEADATRCKDFAPVIDAVWSVTSLGHEVVHGSSDELHSLPPETDTVTRVIGEFPGRAGWEYELKVTFARDLGALTGAKPRLKVAVADIAYTDLQSAGVLVFSISFIFGLFGLILLAVGWYGARRDANHNRP